MTKNEIISLAKTRGFSLWSTENNIGNERYHFMDRLCINLWVDTEGNFELKYLIPNSIFTFECPVCSPFDNEDHFKKIYRKFKFEVVECWLYEGAD